MSNSQAMRRKYRRGRSATRAELRELRKVHSKPGALYGWHADQPTSVRRKHLVTAIRADSWETVVKRLSLMATREKNASPHTTEVAREDLHWVQKNYGNREY